MKQLPFSKEEFKNAIYNCNNLSSPRPDHILQKHLRVVIENNKYLHNIINIANACIDIGYWSLHFKMFSLIIISKHNKIAYNSLKIFHPIVLLNTLGKLIKKFIGKRLQYQSITSNFVYSYQLGSLKQCFTTDIGVLLIYLIHLRWIKSF